MIQRITLTPSQPILIGQYNPKVDTVIVICDTAEGAFPVTMPPLYLCEHKQFTVTNMPSSGLGNAVTLSFPKLNNVDDSTETIYPFDTVTYTDTMGGTWISDAGSGVFGDISTGNYSEFEEDGTLVFKGDATVWEDLNFDVVRSGGPVAFKPDDVTINNVYYKEFTSANNQTCGAEEEVPHSAKLSSAFYPHAHGFLKSGESSGTTGITIRIYWELRQSTGITNGYVDVSKTSAEIAANANKIDFYNSSFTGPTELGAQLAMRLGRTSGDCGDFIFTTYGVHYERDMGGSREITTK